MPPFFLNDRAARLSDQLLGDFAGLGVIIHDVAGSQVIDAGVAAPGGLSAGLALARLCLADLGGATVVPGPFGISVATHTDHPIAACLASQYAGWQIKAGNWFGMGSGPMRAHYGKEELFDDIGCRETGNRVVGILEAAALPTPPVIEYLSEKLRLPAAALSLWIAPTSSLAGCVQVAARSVEVALHKLHALKYDLRRVRQGYGLAPLPAPGKDDLASLGRTNDAILYGGHVHLWVHDDDESLAAVGSRVPSVSSPSYGSLFLDLFKAAKYDFYAMDPHLFAPAVVTFHNRASGRTHEFGQLNDALIRQSFGIGS